MTYKATPEQWHELERHSHSGQPWAPCILELRARFEVLESASRARLIETLRLTNAVADQVPDRTKFLTDTMADEDDSKPTPNDRQIRSSLVKRVALAISGIEYGLELDEEAVNWASEARAAIREVAAWLRENYISGPANVIEQEAER